MQWARIAVSAPFWTKRAGMVRLLPLENPDYFCESNFLRRSCQPVASPGTRYSSHEPGCGRLTQQLCRQCERNIPCPANLGR